MPEQNDNSEQTKEPTEPKSLALRTEQALLKGDLSKLSETERLQYYKQVCESLGLNPLTKPFEYITLNGRLTLYATRACTDQLRAINKVSITISNRERVGEIYIVTSRARMPDGREDESTGAVNIGRASGEALSNLLMKAETKAKRRVTLSICGLGFLDESEVDSIPGATRAAFAESAPIAKMPQLTGAEVSSNVEPGEQTTTTTLESPPFEESPSAPPPSSEEEEDPGEVVIQYGKKLAGKKFKDVDKHQLISYVDWLKKEPKYNKFSNAKEFLEQAERYLTAWHERQVKDQEAAKKADEEMEDIPF